MKDCKVANTDLDMCQYDKKCCCKYCNIQECEDKCEASYDTEERCEWEI